MATSENHLAHPYVDIAHRAALLYSFATMLVAVFVELSAWPTWVNLTAAMVLVFFFAAAIFEYIVHGIRRDTTNQFEHPTPALTVGMIALIIGEVGGFAVLLAGFVAGQLF
jgi:DMSO/TMAO reductase YedYZ heme-binding membrane subunit